MVTNREIVRNDFGLFLCIGREYPASTFHFSLFAFHSKI